MTLESVTQTVKTFLEDPAKWFGPAIYYQLGLIVIIVLLAWVVSKLAIRVFPEKETIEQEQGFFSLKKLSAIKKFIFPFVALLGLGLAEDIATKLVDNNIIIRLAQSIVVGFLLSRILKKVSKNKTTYIMLFWLIVPVTVLFFMGWLGAVSTYLESQKVVIGNIQVSANGIARVIIFGSLLFWLGRISSSMGTRIIRNQQDLDVGTREVIAKVFEVILVIVIFVLILQIMGINITTLAVFGGALGVGLGFGLQSIASNFISGIIILLDRSVTVGDFIELEDGKSGIIRALNMRSTTVETYDGKDIMVPNEKFITSSFVNWTHKDPKQRYSIELQVAYATDLHELFPLLRDAVSSHPQVISGEGTPVEELPDAEIMGFGESGVNILIEFWMEGIDDGRNRVAGDLLLIIWDTLRENNVEIPFPQREVKILNDSSLKAKSFSQ